MPVLNFSVVIPLYNKELSIKSTINSVLIQTYKNFELIIVNDGSTDNSINVVESFNDPRIRIINKKNGGVSSARNTGILSAKNKYIALLDGDDLWNRNHLDTLVRMIITYPNEILYYTKYIHSVDDIDRATTPINIRLIDNYCQEVLRNKNNVWSSCVCLNYDELRGNQFNQKLTHGEDIEFWLRLSRFKDKQFVFCDAVTAVYRLDSENRSTMNESYLDQHHYFFNLDLENTASVYELKYLKTIYTNTALSFLFSFQFRSGFRYIKRYKMKFLDEICYHFITRGFVKILNKIM